MAKTTFPAAWGLTPLETAYLKALKPGKIVSTDTLASLHPVRPTNPPERVRRVVAQLRRKIDPYNVEIATRWSEGWVLERAARQRLTFLLKQASEA